MYKLSSISLTINKQSPLSNDRNYFEVTFFERI